MRAGIFSIFSELHDSEKINNLQQALIKALNMKFSAEIIRSDNFSDYGIIMIAVLTGGSEQAFVKAWPKIRDTKLPLALLAFNSDNSLPASLEIRTWLDQQQTSPHIAFFHGSFEKIANNAAELFAMAEIKSEIARENIGVIGEPSDWLIASKADLPKARQTFATNFVKIPMSEFFKHYDQCSAHVSDVFKKKFGRFKNVDQREMHEAARVYSALTEILAGTGITSLTIRCFDILDKKKTTGCLALACLNDENIVAGCEGDVPAVLSMIIGARVSGKPSFMANPSRVSGNEAIFAHCTAPASMFPEFKLDTHFESGKGLALVGNLSGGPITLFKVDPDRCLYAVGEGEILPFALERNLCRTQLRIRIKDIENYLLEKPLGNHQILIRGHHASKLNALAKLYGLNPVWNQPALP